MKTNDINWNQKLTSRKFWAAIIGFTTAILFAANADGVTVERVTGIITAVATLIAYIVGEGLVDAGRTEAIEVCEVDDDV